MKQKKCPNCGSTDFVEHDQAEYRCEYCDAVFYDDHHKSKDEESPSFEQQINNLANSAQAKFNSYFRKSHRSSFNLVVFIVLLIFFFPAAIIYALVTLTQKKDEE